MLQVVDARSRVLGKEHPKTLRSMRNLAGLYGCISGRDSRLAEAEKVTAGTTE
jgi:hypothetical protein